MFAWGPKSQAELDTVLPDIRRVMDRALSFGIIDMSVLEGRRGRLRQNELFYEGKSKVMWPNGKHNVKDPEDLAEAVDVAPYVNGGTSDKWVHCCYMAGIVLAAAKVEGVPIRWGGNWDQDAEPITDQDFQDLYHFERVQS
jgi:peptidoglycan LD-endopeptidase CwlK